MDTSKILGLVTERGGPTSHVAIMAKSLGIPAIVSAEGIMGSISMGETIILDGETGKVHVRPSLATLQEVDRRMRTIRERRAQWDSLRTLPAMTTDGKEIALYANIGAPDEAAKALEHGAGGVGLFRTEFLFMNCESIPGVEEQRAAYARAAAAMDGAEVIIRTLDVGGDKPIPSVRFPDEENPFLGWRGVRMCLDLPELFETQLEALIRASAEARISIMFPNDQFRRGGAGAEVHRDAREAEDRICRIPRGKRTGARDHDRDASRCSAGTRAGA